MTMSWIWTGMALISIVCGLLTGRGEAVASAAVEGAQSAVELCLSMAGMLCLWMGVMEVMRRSGLAEKLSRLLQPGFAPSVPPGVPRRGRHGRHPPPTYPPTCWDWAMRPPLWGSRPARRLARHSPGRASDAMCMLVVCNTASIQLIPTTVAAVRAAAGSQDSL